MKTTYCDAKNGCDFKNKFRCCTKKSNLMLVVLGVKLGFFTTNYPEDKESKKSGEKLQTSTKISLNIVDSISVWSGVAGSVINTRLEIKNEMNEYHQHTCIL